MDKIKIQNLYKVFGEQPEQAVRLIEQGLDKETIFEQTGMTVGVQNADFSIQQGEIFVVMGLSGSGKSTLVRMLNRLIEPTSGAILVDGQDVTQLNNRELVKFRRRHTGMVFQSFALMPHLSVFENVTFGLELGGASKNKAKEAAQQALEQVGLNGWEDVPPDQLSGGMQQRVGLARALAIDPDILLMDEAFSALDPLIRAEMQDELLRLHDRSKRTVVFISHDIDEAFKLGDRIAIMESGQVIQVGTPDEILQNPADDYVQAFFRGVDPAKVITAGEIAGTPKTTVIHQSKGRESPQAVLRQLNSQEAAFAYILDTDEHFLGIVSTDSLQQQLQQPKEEQQLSQAFLQDVLPATVSDSMQNILPQVASNPWPVPVLDEQGVYQGAVSKAQFLRTLHKAEQETAEQQTAV
ncbi:glycine betaine/L-proline ABC transporter ATP-binding protein ProV [Candidatus Electrothrix sp.]|uniref:glycine betaine/L-proline ABC transporter ATP-binding protein ProV n=1 Tax=Candidatus Electrothrix sp. TaxID=2170559 RepID=UPI00405653F4